LQALRLERRGKILQGRLLLDLLVSQCSLQARTNVELLRLQAQSLLCVELLLGLLIRILQTGGLDLRHLLLQADGLISFFDRLSRAAVGAGLRRLAALLL
jgi:hypothetical protein